MDFGTHLIRPERDLAPASCTAPYVTIVTHVPHPVSELGLETNVARGVQLHSGFLLLLGALSDGLLQKVDLVLFTSGNKRRERVNGRSNNKFNL